MYLSADLIAVQGVLNSVMRKTGEFAKIKFRGGNELKILDVVEEIRKFLCEKNYIKNGSVNHAFDEQLNELIFFLTLNTEFKNSLEMDEYSNLFNVMPAFSSCLLANLAYGLDLCQFYSNTIEQIPLEIGTELLDEMALCLKKAEPKTLLDNADLLLKACINKLKGLEYSNKIENSVDKFSITANVILQNLTGLYSDQTKNMKKSQIYQHMGFTLWKLFGLLLLCDSDSSSFQMLIRNILDTCYNLIQNVTVDVYCEWAEVEVDDRPLQILVAEEAYMVIEKYQKYKQAKSLISILSTFAKKPQSLEEKIADADASTIIAMVNKKNEDQIIWFKALLASNTIKNEDARNCLRTWFHLSSQEDVARLLELSKQINDVELNKVTVKCASVLTVNSLYDVMMQYFYTHKFNTVLYEDVESQLMILFNKINENVPVEDFMKDFFLLILQNPDESFKFMFLECLRNKFYSNYLEVVLFKLKELAAIDRLGQKLLVDIVSQTKPSSQNIESYIALINIILEAGYISKEGLLNILLDPVNATENLEELNCVLQIILGINTVCLSTNTQTYVQRIIDIASKFRCNFIEFSGLKQEISKYAVQILLEKSERHHNAQKLEMKTEDDIYTTFYKNYMSSDTNISLFSHLFSGVDTNTHIECVTHSLRFVPSCVTPEWLLVIREMRANFGCDETVEILCDMMILLSQLTGAQIKIGKEQLNPSLTYCMQQFGIVIQDILQQGCTVEEDIFIAKRMCQMMRLIPEPLKMDLGLPLTNVIPELALKQLLDDTDFVALVIGIRHVPICEALSKRMLNNNS